MDLKLQQVNQHQDFPDFVCELFTLFSVHYPYCLNQSNFIIMFFFCAVVDSNSDPMNGASLRHCLMRDDSRSRNLYSYQYALDLDIVIGVCGVNQYKRARLTCAKFMDDFNGLCLSVGRNMEVELTT